MESHSINEKNVKGGWSKFGIQNNPHDEFFFLIWATAGEFKKQLSQIIIAYENWMQQLNLDISSEIFLEFYIQDKQQGSKIFESDFFKNRKSGPIPSALSVLEMPPLNEGCKITLRGHHIKQVSKNREFLSISNEIFSSISVKIGSYTQYWISGQLGVSEKNPREETKEIFTAIKVLATKNGSMSLLDNLIRTWIYVKEIDTHYTEMVEGRNEFFETLLPAENWKRFPASTGIEGVPILPEKSIHINALMIEGVSQNQIKKMEALDNLPSPTKYGVRFERGLSVEYGDRKHFYISGTASIDQNGDICHPNSVEKQTKRTWENIEKLLGHHSVTSQNLMYLIVYLRNPEDFVTVRETLENLVPKNLSTIYLKGPVCRPNWLVEIEGEAIIEKNNPSFSDF